MSTTTTYTGVRIVDMPDLGAVTDTSSFVAEHAGSGRMAAPALNTYVTAKMAPIATGATAPRLLSDRFADMINVKDFGAKGDGATNDTAAIVAAVAAVQGVTGGSLYFPPGDYRMTPSTFTALHSTRLYGAGIYASQITFTASGTGWTFSNCQNVVLQYLSFRTNTTGISAVSIQAGSGVCTVDTCQFVGFDTDGLQFTGTSGAPLSGHKVLNCLFLQNAGKQLHLLWCNDFWIEGNQYGITSGTPVPAFGCYLDNSSAGTYARNYHWSNNVGFSAVNSNFNRVEMNRFELSRLQGVLMQGCVWTLFSGNMIHTNNTSHTASTAQASFISANGLLLSGNQAFDMGGASQATYGYSIGTGCVLVTLRGNQAAQFTGAPWFIDTSLAGSQAFDADYVFTANSKTTIAAGGGDFIGPSGAAGGGGANAVEVPTGRRSCAVQILVQASAAPGAGQTYTYTLYLNGVASALTCSSSGAAMFTTAATAAVVVGPGDAVCVQVATSAGAAVGTHRVFVAFADY